MTRLFRPKTESRKQWDASWRSVYTEVEAILRERHRDTFDALYAEELVENSHRRTYAYSKARIRLNAVYRDEYRAEVERSRIERHLPRRTGCKLQVSLVKTRPTVRHEMDPLDAMILFNRGMTIAQMAKYDGCSQRAAAKALVPQLMGRRSPSAGWWVQEAAPITSAELSKRLGCHGMEVQRVMDGLLA